jgi:PAS domain S-box-containing protein
MVKNRIIIAEDDAISARYLKESMMARGYEVPDVVTSADELLRAVENCDPDLILMDVMLEGAGDGIDAAERIATRHDIPVIYLTGHTGREILDRAKATGPYGFLVKPVNISELVITVEFALYRHEMGKMLKRSEERYRAIVESAPVMICRFQPDPATITFVNDELCRYFNRTREDLIGQTIRNVLAGSDLSGPEKRYRSLSQEDPVMSFDLRVPIGGGIRWQRWIGRALFDDLDRLTEVQAIGEDITDRKKAEEALRDSEERFYKTFHSSPSGMFILSLKDGRLIDVNQKALDMCGYPREELKEMFGTGSQILIMPEIRVSLGKELKRTGAVRNREIPMKTKSGDMRTVRFSIELLDIGGEQCSLSVISDITEIKKIQDALRDSEEKFRLLFEQSADAQMLIESRKVIDCNMAAVQVFGATGKQDLLKRETDELAPEFLPDGAHAPTRMDEIIPLVYEMDSLSFEWVCRRLDGRQVPVDMTLTAIPIGGRPMIHAVLKDITLRKLAQSALRRSEQKYRVLVEAMNDGLVQGNDQGLITFVNDQFCEMVDRRKNEVIGRSILDFIHEADREVFRENILGKRSARASAYEIALVLPEGLKTGIVVSPRPLLDDQERITGFVAVFTDISERKHLERQILEISMKEQQRIGRDLHDDIGQILAGTGFLSESLVKKLSAKDVPEVHEAREITALLNQAKEHTRLLSRGLSPVEVDSGGLVAALERLAKTMENVFSVSCELTCDPSITINDSMVETQFHYIVQEAITNSIKHGKAGQITISLRNRRGFVRLDIEDDGSGIPDDVDPLKGMGLRIMQYRAKAIGATIKIGKNSRGGTSISCVWRRH